eukprot:6182523-Pleurochrysis_carterae.AAC.2
MPRRKLYVAVFASLRINGRSRWKERLERVISFCKFEPLVKHSSGVHTSYVKSSKWTLEVYACCETLPDSTDFSVIALW